MKKKKVSMEDLETKIEIIDSRIIVLKDLMRIYDKYTNKHLAEINNVVWFVGYWVVGMIAILSEHYIIAFASFILGFFIFMMGRKL